MCSNCGTCRNDSCTIYDHSICGDPCPECRGAGLSRRTAMTKPGYATASARDEGLCGVIALVLVTGLAAAVIGAIEVIRAMAG
jgi:hypothetical protein